MSRPKMEQTFRITVSGRTYFNIVLPALEQLDLPAPYITRAGRGARANFASLSEEQAYRLAGYCSKTGLSWGVDTAASSILSRVFIKDGARVLDQIHEQKRASGTRLEEDSRRGFS